MARAVDQLSTNEAASLDTMGAGVVDGDEVLVSVWSGADLSVTVISSISNDAVLP